MTPTYTAHLSLTVKVTNVGMQKIDRSLPATYDIVIAAFQVVDKLGRSQFFQETFLLADISIKVVLGKPFFTLSNVNIQCAEKELTWKTYTTKDALPTTGQVEIINCKEFAKAVLDENDKAFVVHVSSLGLRMSIHPIREAQLALLLTENVIVPVKYSDFADVFSEKSADILPERTRANEYAIKLQKSKQPPYRPIYSLQPVELEILKIYIEINLANGFIQALKLLADAQILFIRKPDDSLCLCVYYRGLNNLTIKNRYLLPLISKSLDWFGQAKQFT